MTIGSQLLGVKQRPRHYFREAPASTTIVVPVRRRHSSEARKNPERRRAAVAPLIATMTVSEGFASWVTGQNRTTQRREPTGTTTADPDAALREWLRSWAKNHPPRGFRNAYEALGEGWNVNHKKIQRLWREEGLRVPQKRRRERLGTSSADRPKADA